MGSTPFSQQICLLPSLPLPFSSPSRPSRPRPPCAPRAPPPSPCSRRATLVSSPPWRVRPAWPDRDPDMRRYEIMEIKHGRAAMLGFLHVIAIEAGVRVPGYLSISQDLKFADVPAGLFASLEAVPTAGWLQ